MTSVTWRHGGGSRIVSLAEPLTAGMERIKIWAASWELLKQSPIIGHGLGSYTFLYPAYRHPADSSTGYFVHNDYFQIWLEAGLPALLLLVSLLILVLVKFIHATKNKSVPVAARIELTGWFCAVFAIALHSLVTFNFYVLTTLIIVGMMLARMSQIIYQYQDVKYWRLQPSRLLGKVGYRIVILLLILFPITYLASISLAIYETERGLGLAKQGWLDKADRAFARAARYYPYADNILISHADLYRHVIILLPKSAVEEKKVLYGRAHDLLNRAEQLNPLRPLNFLVRGRLYQQNSSLAGIVWRQKAITAYQHALALNPRYFQARLAYARLHLRDGEWKAAHKILEAGLKHWYYDNEYIAPYFTLTAKLRLKAGDIAGASMLDERVKIAMANSGWRWVPRPEAESGVKVPTRSVKQAVSPPK